MKTYYSCNIEQVIDFIPCFTTIWAWNMKKINRKSRKKVDVNLLDMQRSLSLLIPTYLVPIPLLAIPLAKKLRNVRQLSEYINVNTIDKTYRQKAVFSLACRRGINIYPLIVMYFCYSHIQQIGFNHFHATPWYKSKT